MTFSFSSLIRLIVVACIGATILAIGLSRLDPDVVEWRARRLTSYISVNEYFLNVLDRTPQWLDAETGVIKAFPLEEDNILDAASCSPWIDEDGSRQVVGRWSNRTKQGAMSITTDFGLGRYRFPGGRMIDQVSTEAVPVGPPCWFPGTRARVLFASGDGNLYQYAFEPEPWQTSETRDRRRDDQPRPVTWRCPKPGLGSVFLSDLTWPEDPRMSGYVVVSLREQTRASETQRSYSGSHLWWLRLDLAGTEILEAGRLISSDPSLASEITDDQRSPTVGRLSDGSLVLAYLNQPDGHSGWELRCVPITFREDRAVPTALASASVVMADHCHPTHPSFASDGRWLNAIGETSRPGGRVIRVSTESLIAHAR